MGENRGEKQKRGRIHLWKNEEKNKGIIISCSDSVNINNNRNKQKKLWHLDWLSNPKSERGWWVNSDKHVWSMTVSGHGDWCHWTHNNAWSYHKHFSHTDKWEMYEYVDQNKDEESYVLDILNKNPCDHRFPLKQLSKSERLIKQ